jgi:hypothetical protein
MKAHYSFTPFPLFLFRAFHVGFDTKKGRRVAEKRLFYKGNALWRDDRAMSRNIASASPGKGVLPLAVYQKR